jgi:hypothetical protein
VKTLTLGLLLLISTPVCAEETILSQGDRWYHVSNQDPVVVIPPDGATEPITICLDEIPGGLDSTPAWQILPIQRGHGDKQTVTASREAFVPIGAGGAMPYASVVLHGVPGTAYTVGVIIRGKQ